MLPLLPQSLTSTLQAFFIYFTPASSLTTLLKTYLEKNPWKEDAFSCPCGLESLGRNKAKISPTVHTGGRLTVHSP